MTDKTDIQIIDGLNQLLEEERLALLSGDLDAIADLLPKKVSLVEQLNALQDRDDLELDDLRQKAGHNQNLLDGTLDGIRRVSSKLSDLRRLRHSFDTYDSDGARLTIEGRVTRNVEKRA